MKLCQVCGREFEDKILFCPFDGSSLISKTQPQDRFIDTLFDERYRITEKVGEGGMGKVYKAHHIHMDVMVAIKILHSHLASDQNTLSRFRREARAAAQIVHPNAVRVIDFGVERETGTAYLVMEFLEGCDLRQRLKQNPVMDFEEAVNIFRQACAGVHAAHLKGIIHRDLKPDNVWLLKAEDKQESVKVLDFGIAKLRMLKEDASMAVTQAGMVIGTPHYMSPEQCRGEELDPRADIYSLGVIFFEMITGDVPFQSQTPLGIVHKHIFEPPPDPRQRRPDLPEQVARALLRSLSKDKEGRQSTAIELASEIEQAFHSAGFQFKLGAYTMQFTSAQMTSGLPSDSSFAPPSIPGQRIGGPVSTSVETLDKQLKGTSPISSEPRGMLFGSERATPVSGLFQLKDEQGRISKAKLSFIGGMIIVIALVAVWFVVLKPKHAPAPDPNSNIPIPGPNPSRPEVPSGMILIRGGQFTMGNNNSEDEAEKPEQTVTVKSFYIDKYEVTNQQYYEFIKATRYKAPLHWNNGRFEDGKETHPVVNVNWEDAKKYAEWAGKRLPKEEEWEYAARGIDGRLYPWGKLFSPTNANTKESGKGDTTPVGSYSSGQSPFGVMDMSGNVLEWTASKYSPYPGSKAKPVEGYVVLRGGDWYEEQSYATATSRALQKPDFFRKYIGFRCAKDAP
ncbi:MAG: bifunctional serine/threonine-protein kinase/formylglycine-generating enzyme family protein [Acidobacteriota bacterium]